MRKRIFSVILAIAMLACMIPMGMVSVFAEETHTHTPGTEYMTNGVAHWLKCGGDDCDLETVEDYKAAFKKDETLKTTLGYKNTCDDGILMGRQGKIIDSVVSKTVGRTIFGLTQDQLDSIVNNLVIIGSDGEKQVNITVDCAYTYFYNGDQKVEAGKDGLEAYAAFVIIDNDGTTNDDNTINGYGYYRLYSDSTDNFLFDAQFRDPVLYLDSITVQPPTKLEYKLDESLDTTGMTVTAHYKKGEEDKNVTSLVTNNSPEKFENLGTVTVTVSYTENDVTKTDFFDVMVANTVYVVSLWDVDQNGVATFGPALGADNTCLDVHHEDGPCIHTDSWETIKENLKKNPAYYDACLTKGCTKNVPLALNETISGTVSSSPASALYDSIKKDYRKYVNSTSGATYGSINWSTSRIRATLNGYDNTFGGAFTPSSYAGNNCLTKDTCLLSCFPKNLQNIITPRTYKVETAWSSSIPYTITENTSVTDKLWLPSATEIRGDAGLVQYYNSSENQFDKFIGITNINTFIAYNESATANQWLLRSMNRQYYNQVMTIAVSGGLSGGGATYNTSGIAPCFCIGG